MVDRNVKLNSLRSGRPSGHVLLLRYAETGGGREDSNI